MTTLSAPGIAFVVLEIPDPDGNVIDAVCCMPPDVPL